jgi:hypothetical protein
LTGSETLALKLVVTPLLVGAASLAARRWGSEVGGWLVGIPFTSAPVTFFLALGPGTHFAAQYLRSRLYATVLAVFSHRLQGAESAVSVLRGLLLGLFAFAGFFLTVAQLLERDGIALAFGAVILVALALQAASLVAGRRLAIA